MKLEKLLLACSGQLSRHALFCLLTLLILLGLTLGLVCAASSMMLRFWARAPRVA